MTQVVLSPEIEKALADLRAAIEAQIARERVTSPVPVAPAVAPLSDLGLPATTSVSPTPTTAPTQMPPVNNVVGALKTGAIDIPPLPTPNIVSPITPHPAAARVPVDNHIDEEFDGRQVASAANINILGEQIRPNQPTGVTPSNVAVDMTREHIAIPAPEPTAIDDVAPTNAPAPQAESETTGLSRANSLLASIRSRGWSSKQ